MISVSIVDDEKDLRESIKTFVDGSPGFRCVSSYSNAAAALAGLPTDKPDVVLALNVSNGSKPRRPTFKS
jgi:DNA-binding NarL/FixJ family response regulator